MEAHHVTLPVGSKLMLSKNGLQCQFHRHKQLQLRSGNILFQQRHNAEHRLHSILGSSLLLGKIGGEKGKLESIGVRLKTERVDRLVTNEPPLS